MKKTTIIAGVLFAATIFFGCQTVPKEISEELDARQLIQLGQDNYDLHHYKAAEKYFNTVLERYGDDPKHYLEAKYELGHLYLKQKKYAAAYDNFKEIEEIYASVPVGLPGSYKILCGIELAKIPPEKIKEIEDRKKAAQEAPQETPEERAAREAERKEAAQKSHESAVNEQIEREKSAAQKQSEPPKDEGPSEVQEEAATVEAAEER